MRSFGQPAPGDEGQTASRNAESRLHPNGLLANDRRRVILEFLERIEMELIERDTLARSIAVQEFGLSPGAAGVHRFEVALHHNHLPALDDAGLVEYDRDDCTVSLTTDGELQSQLPV